MVWAYRDMPTAEELRREYEERVSRKDISVVLDDFRELYFDSLEPNKIIETIEAGKVVMKELEEQWYFNIRMALWPHITIWYSYFKSYIEFIDWWWVRHRVEEGLNTWQNRVKRLVKEKLNLSPQHWGVRLIYVKLFLEDKISEEDLKMLIQSKDMEFYDELQSMVPEWTSPLVLEGETPIQTQQTLHQDWFVFINN